MPKFVALITGSGEGCDYTLGCNIRWKIGEATSKDDFARIVLEDHGMFDYRYEMDIPYEKLQIFEVQGEALVLENLDLAYHEECKKYQIKKKEDAERAEYERLKTKYEA